MAERIVVSIFRRGAAAMTNEVIPHQSVPNVSYFDDYRTSHRFPNAHAAAINTTLLDGEDGYGINNVFTAFLNQWKNPGVKSAAFVALGTPAPTRSHFYEQGRIDGGGVEYNFANVGYFNRFAGLFPPAVPDPLDLISIGNTACRMTIGQPSSYAAAKSIVPLLEAENVATAKAFMQAAEPFPVVQAVTGRATAFAMLDTNMALTNLPTKTIVIPTDSTATGVPKYPNDGWALKLRDCAKMIIAGCKSRVMCVDYDGWDHHSDMGGTKDSPAGERNHATMFKVFNDAIVAFLYDMNQSGNADRVLLTSTTEFHRTARENGNYGADHGQSSHAYAWGPTVKSDIYAAHLDYRENSAAYADPGFWQSPFPNRLLNHLMDYRDFQRLQCEWLLKRLMTDQEVAAIWGNSFTSNMSPSQRVSITPN